ncbi:MAG: recombinase RecA [Erysipelotrichaceae bacterium]|nr:recombinase RecA [Erysipelotrichaceae bacterium]MBQ1304060.1 recombinase RecA [Erysipelotrichaceae bacterium]MBQ2684951.1 recombinase RecA [Erysipelotrichaceae bacterium]MBR2791066.1 recombinase RecA [Erysipelotrichaceae bacterium]MBR6957314.1 recombinase RecA [Erysipelotrichaceae bacterium]
MAEKSNDTGKILDETIKEIEKQYGKGSIMRLGDAAALEVDAIPTGSLLLDRAIGIGGYPRGRIIEIYGPESSGKTTLALHAVAEVQKSGGKAAFIDAENAIDPVYAKSLGVNIDELILSQPDSGEQALEISELLINSGAIDIIVVDSVAALVPQQELDGVIGDNTIGLRARLMSRALGRLSRAINRSRCTVIFINQIRQKIGVVYGNPETTTGGLALKFYASLRIEIRKGEAIKQGTEIIGNKTNIKIVKNKVAPPFKSCQVEIRYGEGISRLSEIIDLAVDYGLLEKSGTWFSYQGEKLGQGKENVRGFLNEHPEIVDELEMKIRAEMNKKDE